MGQSTDGEISYGIEFGEDFEFPWDNEEFEGDIEEWWLVSVNGYEPPFQMYDDKGNYLNGVEPSKAEIKDYYDHRRIFAAEHPALPVELVNTCSGDYPMYILALKGTVKTANRGFPVAFNPAELVVTDEQRQTLIDFCKTHGIDTDGAEPSWYLSSYWG